MSSIFYREDDGFPTVCVHSGHNPDDFPDMPITEPLILTSTFQQSKPGVFKVSFNSNIIHSSPTYLYQSQRFNYQRTGNPCRLNLETRLAEMEGAKYAACFPSGVSVVFAIGSIFPPGSHFVVSRDLYGGTTKCFVEMAKKRNVSVDYVDMATDLTSLKKTVTSDTKLLWLESPTNPTMNVVDIQAVCAAAKAISKDIVIVVDNTFLTAYFQKPLELGATVSMYSLTKYINGHADVIMGAAVTNCPTLFKEFQVMQEVNGLCASPFDCLQVTRGSKTLALRMEKHHENSLKIARYLETNKFVTKVNHPGLETHPSHALSIRQATGHSGIMSFCIKGGLPEVRRFIDHLKVIKLAASLGGVETLVASPALMIHDMITQEKRDSMGITDCMIRLAVGIESANDLISDIEQALKATYE